MTEAIDIINEMQGKLNTAKLVGIKKHCSDAGCNAAKCGVCRIYGTQGVCMANKNSFSYAELRRVCNDPVMLDLVVKARNQMLDAGEQQSEIALLKGGE